MSVWALGPDLAARYGNGLSPVGPHEKAVVTKPSTPHEKTRGRSLARRATAMILRNETPLLVGEHMVRAVRRPGANRVVGDARGTITAACSAHSACEPSVLISRVSSDGVMHVMTRIWRRHRALRRARTALTCAHSEDTRAAPAAER